MNIFDKKSEQFLFHYLNNASPTGYETAGQKIWIEYIKPYVDKIESDAYGTVYAVINPDHPYKVVIEAHADEISWFVNHIDSNGFIRVMRNGGSDHCIAPSKKVHIHTDNGVVSGFFGWPAIHTRRGKNAKLSPQLENIFIDVGAKDKEEVKKLGIEIGNVITFDDELMAVGKNYLAGKSLDNKMGGFCIAQVAKMLQKNKKTLPFGLYIVNAVQEEIGLRGAQMIANTIKPNCAIVTDVTHDTSTPMIDEKVYGDIKCGEGPAVTFAPSVHNKLLDLIIATAKKNKIPLQREVASRSTGTDTDAFAYSGGGVPAALISLPLRYMHTTVEMAHREDISQVTHLIYNTLLNIKENHSFKYLD